jgi:hypothetical protein
VKTLIAKLAIREFWMFSIAGVSLLVVAIIAVAVVWKGVPEGAGEVLSVVVTGLLLRIGDVINAIRALWRVSQEHIEAEPGEG